MCDERGDVAQERAKNCPQKTCNQPGSAAFCEIFGHNDGQVAREK